MIPAVRTESAIRANATGRQGGAPIILGKADVSCTVVQPQLNQGVIAKSHARRCVKESSGLSLTPTRLIFYLKSRFFVLSPKTLLNVLTRYMAKTARFWLGTNRLSSTQMPLVSRARCQISVPLAKSLIGWAQWSTVFRNGRPKDRSRWKPLIGLFSNSALSLFLLSMRLD